MRVLVSFGIASIFFVLAWGLPTGNNPYLEIQDAQIVESTVREVRAASPIHYKKGDDVKSFHYTYGDEKGGDNDKGYHKRTKDQGNKGYKHFDSFHKKGGDKYGYESHSAYGKEEHDEADGGGHSGKYSVVHDEGPSSGGEAVDHEGEEETKNTYQVVEYIDEDGGNYGGGNTGGHAESYTDDDSGHYYAEGGDSYDNGHYTGAGHHDGSDENAGHYTEGGDYGSEGSSGHYTSGSSGHAYGGNGDGGGSSSSSSSSEASSSDDGGVGTTGSEHYETAEDYDTY